MKLFDERWNENGVGEDFLSIFQMRRKQLLQIQKGLSGLRGKTFFALKSKLHNYIKNDDKNI